MGLFRAPHEWTHLGGALGLSPYEPTAGYSPGVSFRQIKRSLGVDARHLPPSFNHWHYGKVRGREIILLHYEVGSGSSSTTYTGLGARIDPPLFLGIGLSAKPLLELFAKPFLTGDAFVDAQLRVTGFDPRRVVEFLALDTLEGRELVSQVIAHIDHLHVTDSLVMYASTGYEHDLAKSRWQLDLVTAFAQRLGQLRSRLRRSPDELALRADWQTFADAVGFTVDPERMTTFGQHKSSHLKIALETEGQQIRTAVNIRFPQRVNVAFTARRTQMPSFLQGLFGQDIKIGDPVFDDLYLVTGYPEPLVRQTLAHGPLLEVLRFVGTTTTEVQLNQDQLFFRVKGALSSSHLHSICETARITSEALFGRAHQVAPYR